MKKNGDHPNIEKENRMGDVQVKHVVTVWGTTLQSDEELQEFLEPLYDENGDVGPSGFLAATGLNWVDEDFFEAHVLGSEEEKMAFPTYLKEEYAPEPEVFERHLPENLTSKMSAYPSVILLYGNESGYGSINEQLFQLHEQEKSGDSPIVLLSKIVYETADR